jgi:hypothetical protein
MGAMRIIAPLLLALLLAGPAGAEEPRILFSEKSALGQLWANLSVTHLRSAESYLPMVIGIQNLSSSKLVIDRDSVRLIGPDGRRYPMAELKEVRSEYPYFGLDHRIVSGAGIPYDVWRRQRNLRESNFFPDIRSRGRATVIDRVTLRRGDGMVDLVYFIRPPGLAPGLPFALEVDFDEFRAPLRLRLVLHE